MYNTILEAIRRAESLAAKADRNSNIYRRVVDDVAGPNHYDCDAARYRANADILRRFLARLEAQHAAA